MAGTTQRPHNLVPGQTVEYELYIQDQLAKTRRQVKLVELSVAAIQLCVLVLGYVLLVVLIDHWLFATGLGTWGRMLALAGLVGGGVGFFVWRVLPLIAARVNPIYAAHSIEQIQPASKNSLINFLLLRRQRDALAAPIYDAIERKAATDLADAPIDTAVDRSHLIKAGYALLALVTILCLYKLLSPKDPLRTVGRMAAPWANLPPATRVTIDDIQPGATNVFQGEPVTVSALVMGLRRDEPVTIYYSTADGQIIDQPLTMHLPESHYRHEAVMPGDAAGVQQTLEYYIQAGDATSDRYRIEAVTAPAILVERVEYQYPRYLGLPPRVVERQGDLKAPEGTKVLLRARANVPIESAYIDFNSDGGRDLPLVVEGQEARGEFVLALNQQGEAQYKSYQIRFLDSAGHENPQPVRHSIEVLADQPPAIEILEPTSDPTEVALNGSQAIALRAADRDFKLRRVTLFFTHRGQEIKEEVLLDKPHAGTFQGAMVFRPQEIAGMQFKSGDLVEFWAEARDNRAPNSNRSETLKYRLRLKDKVSAEEAKRQQRQAEEQAQAIEEEQSAPGDPRAASAPGTPDPTAQGEDQLGSAQQQPPDPEQDPGRAMETILQHTGNQPDAGSPSQAQDQSSESEQPTSGGQQQQRQQENASGDAGDQRSNRDEEGPQQGQSQQQGASEQGRNSQTEQGAGEQSGGEGDSQQDSSGQGQGAGQQSRQQGNQQAGEQSQGSGQPGSEGEQGTGQQGDGQQQGQGQQRGQGQGQQPGGNQQRQGQPTGQQGAQQRGDRAGEQGQSQSDGQPGEGEQAQSQQGGGQRRPGQPPQGEQQPQQGEQAQGEQPGERGQQRQQGQGEQAQPSGQQQQGQGGQQQQPQAGAGDQQAQGGSQSGQRGQQRQQPGQQGQSPGAGERAGEQAGMKEKQQPGDQQSEDEAAGSGDSAAQHGNSGAGESSQKNKPTPPAQGENQARNKSGEQSPAGQDQNENREEGSSPSTSNKESSAQGGESGDRSGGGKQGGGQRANQEGTGAAGQNTASDEGAGQSAGEGDGETSNSAGDRVAGQQPRDGQGQGQQTPGQGRPRQSGQQAGQQPGAGGDRQGGQQRAGGQPGSSGDGMSEMNDDMQDAAPGGSAEAVQTAPDEANLDYKRRATELVLDRLKDQIDRNQVDQELLKKLNWSQEDLQRFVERWDRLRAEAQQDDEGRKRFEQTLDRLNLQRRGVGIRQQGGQGDDRALREMRWTNPPAEYEEQFKAYTEGTTRGTR